MSKKAREAKRGAPSLIAKHREDKRPTGLNVDEKWLKIIIMGGEMFFEHRKRNYSEAYRLTLERFCKKGYNPETKNVILPHANKNEVFTLRQFKYHYQQHQSRNLRRVLIRRHGQRRFNLRYRDIKGNSTDQAPYPGALYQVDATLADVYLVSRLNPNHICGRPRIWVIIDVFSRLIVGVSVRFEGEGWLGLMMSLLNSTEDKVPFCAKYGIKIPQEMWPACALSDQLTGDRGPLESYNADHLVDNLNIHISNTPPYRADWKGIIEQIFRLLNIRMIHGLPGAVDPNHERGDKDYRLDATLDIDTFTETVVSAVLFHNNRCRMNWYPVTKEMIADEVAPFPLEIYHWGIQNLSGTPRYRDPETIRVNLLPGGVATVTESGIRFGPEYYTCELAERGLEAKGRHIWALGGTSGF